MIERATGLFDPYSIRGVTFRNRAWVSPMCMYSAAEGLPNEWHSAHLGGLARGGAGMVMVESTGVTPEGRITPGCSGMWTEGHAEAYRPLTRFMKAMGSVPGIQLGHAGRKGSTSLLWEGSHYVGPEAGGWATMAPSPLAFDELPRPREMTQRDIDGMIGAFVDAAQRAIRAGFEVIEIHAAHGYLLHQFLSPLSNHRTDLYGGSLENRSRVVVDTASEVRGTLGADVPLFVRVSATDWVDGGWTLADTIYLSGELKSVGVDLIDCSSGGLVPDPEIAEYDGYQVPFAKAVRESVGIATAAVGRIRTPVAANAVIASGAADAVFLGRVLLRNPHWPLLAAEELSYEAPWPMQYWQVAKRPVMDSADVGTT